MGTGPSFFLCENVVIQLIAVAAADVGRAEYLLFHMGGIPRGPWCVSHRTFRVEDEEDAGEAADLDTRAIAEGMVQDLDRRDPWLKTKLLPRMDFMPVDDGPERLAGAMREVRAPENRRGLRESLETMRRRARTLDVKLFLDGLLRRSEMESLLSVPAASCLLRLDKAHFYSNDARDARNGGSIG